ncbi:MAG: VWA domain-containing protein [Polyangiaceae bacterium]|nr:VWA domain-containing protein [Polyangiaceae bacterium]
MGHGGYSYEAHQAITSARAKLPAQAVFTQRTIHPLMNPLGVAFRESRDSAEHPSTTSIVFALDVSGSMGQIPQQIARKELPTFMKALLDAGVTDPQVLFMALQDCAGGVSPLQVGQFESTAELMDQWLTWCWLMGGGMSAYESYDLAFYFAAHHTKLDCFEKRGKKGYLFMTGDEPCYDELKSHWVKQFIGDDLSANVPLKKVIADCAALYHTFYLVPDPGRGRQVAGFWREYLGEQTIILGDPEDTCAVAAGIVALSEGCAANLEAVGAKLSGGGLDRARVARVLNAMKPWAESIGKS